MASVPNVDMVFLRSESEVEYRLSDAVFAVIFGILFDGCFLTKDSRVSIPLGFLKISKKEISKERTDDYEEEKFRSHLDCLK
jgi:hypothetical protein